MSRRKVAKQAATGAVIYLRVSTTKQANSGAGLEAQEASCRAHCERLGLPIVGVERDEGLSGKDAVARRPGLQKAIAVVQSTPGSVLVVYSLSRLGRSQRLIWTLLDPQGDYALPLSSATEPFDTASPMGRAMLGMLAVWSQLEADLVSERTIDALAIVKARGVKLGAPGMSALAPETVAKVRELYATGTYSHRSLAEHLNVSGVPSAKGARWHSRTVAIALAA